MLATLRESVRALNTMVPSSVTAKETRAASGPRSGSWVDTTPSGEAAVNAASSSRDIGVAKS